MWLPPFIFIKIFFMWHASASVGTSVNNSCWTILIQCINLSYFGQYIYMLHFWRFLSIENLVGYFELFWRHIYINAPNTAWRYIDRSLQALQTLYWPLKFSGSKKHHFNNDGHLTVRATLFKTARESAGVTLSLEFRIDFSSILTSKM